jgi:hypothetical protein
MTATSTIQPSSLSLYGPTDENVRIHPTSLSWFNGGNVGIGSSQPQTLLDVAGIATIAQLNMTGLTVGPSGIATELSNLLNLNLNFRGGQSTANIGAAFRIDGRGDVPLFQWFYRPPTVTADTLLANMNSSGKLALGMGVTPASYMLEIKSNDGIQLSMNRTAAGTNYSAGILHSLTSAAGYTANYVRTYGGSFGDVATTAQNQATGMFIVDPANAGVFATSGDWATSAMVISPSKSWFNTTVGIGTSTPATGSQLHVNGAIRNSNPAWFGYNLGVSAISGTVTYTTLGITTTNCSFTTGGNGRATITVAGRYYVFFSGFAEADGATNTQHYLRKNGAFAQRCYNGSKVANSFGPSMSLGVVFDLAVNDYVDVVVDMSTLHGNQNCFFGGYMIG